MAMVMTVHSVAVIGRGSAGVRLFNVAENEHVVAAAKIDESGEEEVETAEGTTIAPELGATVGEDLAAGDEEGTT